MLSCSCQYYCTCLDDVRLESETDDMVERAGLFRWFLSRSIVYIRLNLPKLYQIEHISCLFLTCFRQKYC